MRAFWLFLWNGLLKRPFKIGDKIADIVPLELSTSPALLLNEDYYPGYRVAQREDLEEFVKAWYPSYPVHALGALVAETTIFGPAVSVLGTIDGKVEPVEQNLVWGMPPRSVFLFIKK